ncbi:Zinc finger CCCH domain-containing protein 25 [Cardamine amara subsp. amara]|uniref:Zinc finger CCCH domain-containing protein 25 n=1 Tax=Cardamine amara subsp. amara TaxID=228776 RepID=A0ABD0ZM14_CARAN
MRLMDENVLISLSFASLVSVTILTFECQRLIMTRSVRSVPDHSWFSGGDLAEMRDARYKKTEVCQTCRKLKNVCQVCLLDLEYGIPVQVRNTALNISTHDSIPKSYVNQEFFAEEQRYQSKAGEMGTLESPEEESIKRLYVGGLNSRVFQQDIRDQFYAYGEIESIRILVEKACAFVTYTTRDGAEKTVEELSNRLVVNGQRLKLTWGRPQVPKPDQDGSNQQGSVAHSGLLPRTVISQQHNQPPPMQQYYMHLPPSQPSHQDRPFYPSMDPQRMGAVISSQDSSPSTSDNRGASSSSYPMPPHGHYPHQPYPPPPYGGYMQPPYQQYPPHHHGPPQAAHPYPRHLGSGSRPNPPPSSVSAPPPDSVSGPPSGSSQQSSDAAVVI